MYFGLIFSLYKNDYKAILDGIAMFGSNPNSKLTKIGVSNWKIKEKCIDRLKPIFPRITSFSIEKVDENHETFAKILELCTELKELKLRLIYFGNILKIKFPKLET